MRNIFIGLMLSITLAAIEVKPLPQKLNTTTALYHHCLELTQSQQLLKEYILIGLNNRYKGYKETLPKSVEAYDRRLDRLHKFFDTKFTNPKDKESFANGVKKWKLIKHLLLEKPSKENAKNIQTMLPEMYKDLKSTKVLSKNSFLSVKLAGRICYSSQEVANLYLMEKAWNINIPNYDAIMEKEIKIFASKIKKLKSQKINNQKIKDSLKAAEKSYRYFVFMYNSQSTVIPTLIAKKSNRIFKEIESAKQEYGKLLKK